jgi:hypothetical protein
MDQYNRTRIIIILSCCLLAGCAWLNPKPDAFVRLNPAQARHMLRQISSETNGLRAVKCRGDITLTVMKNNEPEITKADVLYLWLPGRALRVRIKYFNVTVLSILYDGNRWYLADDMNTMVSVCSRVDQVYSKTVPHAFFVQLQQLPDGWITRMHDNSTVAVNEYAIRVETLTDQFSQVLIFPKGSPLPSEARLEMKDGSTLSALLHAPVTNLAINPAMFTPRFDGYEVQYLDKQTAAGQ